MKTIRVAVAVILALSILPFRLVPQENPKPDTKKPSSTLKVQVTFTETEGEKKVANLPYTFFLKTSENTPGLPPSWTKLRMGSRVPVYAGKEGGMQYIDIGTNIDARALPSDSGRYDVFVNLERSWVEGDVSIAMPMPEKGSNSGAADQNGGRFKEPIIRQFKTELTLTMHDGETIQTAQAADPLSARILTITVTINAVK
jgi:hypothetical protein